MPRVQYNRLQNIINRIVYRPYSIDINFNGDNASLRLNGHKQIKSSAYYRPNLMDIDIYFFNQANYIFKGYRFLLWRDIVKIWGKWVLRLLTVVCS